MKLTHKAIARAAGYRVASNDANKRRFTWYDTDDDSGYTSWHDTEEAAYKACCEDNQLIIIDNTGKMGPR